MSLFIEINFLRRQKRSRDSLFGFIGCPGFLFAFILLFLSLSARLAEINRPAIKFGIIPLKIQTTISAYLFCEINSYCF